MTETSQTSPFFSEPFKCPVCPAKFQTFKELLEHAEDPSSHYPDTVEIVLCFKCGGVAVGATWFMTGTKEGVPCKVQLVNVCEQCYDVLKEKAATRSRLSDPPEAVN